MKTMIEKMIAEYQNKIGECDFVLELNGEMAAKARAGKYDMVVQDCLDKRNVLQAKRQVLVQAMSDLGSLLDRC